METQTDTQLLVTQNRVFQGRLTILIIRNLRSFLDILPGAYLSFADIRLSSFLVVTPSCVLLGAQFVFLAKSW